MRPLHVRSLMAALALMLALAAPALALEIERWVMPNGIVVLHVERTNLPIVAASMMIRGAGSVAEPSQKAGLAGITASLLMEGTSSRTSKQISQEIEFIGASLAASASFDYATVGMTALKKDAATGFALMSDILLNPSFPQEEITRKIALRKGGIRQSEENPEYIAERRFGQLLYPDSAYGRPVEGFINTLDAIGRQDVIEFYGANFKADRAILAVVGDITRPELEKLVSDKFSGWEAGGQVAAQEQITHDSSLKGVGLIERELAQATIMLGHRGISRDNPDYYAVGVMNYILGGGGFSSRMMDSIREDMGLAYGVYSAFVPYRDAGEFYVSVQTKNESSKVVVDEALRQMRLMIESGVTEKELREAKDFLTGSFPRRIDTMGKIADFLSSVEFYGLGLDYQDKYASYINAVTREDVLRVARQYLHPDSFILVVVGNKEGLSPFLQMGTGPDESR